jgi:hypothetical protein
MSNPFELALPSDVCLLLRADAEQRWLHHEVIPVLREIEAPEQLPEEEVGAALAYLEAMWSEASLRARETDAAHHKLCSHEDQCDALSKPASRYHAAVRSLRGIVAERVMSFVEPMLELDERRGEGNGGVRVTDKRSGGCAPRAV